ncbi:MAG: hypothetical protein ACRD8Z_04130 [Nitrososphaeraceae archaeon]
MINENIRTDMLILATTLLGIVVVIAADSDSPLLATPEANMHLDEGIKVLQGGDTQAAMTHVKASQSALIG